MKTSISLASTTRGFAMAARSLALLAMVLCCAQADVYMHAPRGSNDRNCEKNVNRNNGNRLFDSQNNAKGGYACPRPRVGPTTPVDKTYYHVGSKLVVEWTNQHGCGTNPMTGCEIVIQYACEDTLDPTKKYRSGDGKHIGAPRDGTPENAEDAATDRISETDEADAKADTVKSRRFGMHESMAYYKRAKQRVRNKGLFIADRNVRNDATGTRQNPNGNRRGLEVPEERDYYPYWEPSPWRDVAVITSNPEKCTYYKQESANVKPRGLCRSATELYGSTPLQRFACPVGRLESTAAEPGVLASRGTTHPGNLGAGADPELIKLKQHPPAKCAAHGLAWTPVWWDEDHPKTAAALAELKKGGQASLGGFKKEFVSSAAISGASQPARVALATGGPMKSCAPMGSLGDYYGCPEDYTWLPGAKQCVQSATGLTYGKTKNLGLSESAKKVTELKATGETNGKNLGCDGITDEKTCVGSKDGRTDGNHDAPCAWCCAESGEESKRSFPVGTKVGCRGYQAATIKDGKVNGDPQCRPYRSSPAEPKRWPGDYTNKYKNGLGQNSCPAASAAPPAGSYKAYCNAYKGWVMCSKDGKKLKAYAKDQDCDAECLRNKPKEMLAAMSTEVSVELQAPGDVFEIHRGLLVQDKVKTSQYYSLSFEFKSTENVKKNEYRSVLHFTTGENHNKPGSRNPAIWLVGGSGGVGGAGRLHIRQGHAKNHNDGCDPAETKDDKPWAAIEKDKWYTITVQMDSTGFTVYVDGIERCKNTNYARSDYALYNATTVKVYASNPWDNPAVGQLRNIDYTPIMAQGKSTAVALSPYAQSCEGCKDFDLMLSTYPRGRPFVYTGSAQFAKAWYPFCGHYFWDNQEGATSACIKMGYTGGIVHKLGNQRYSQPSYAVGRCQAGQEIGKCDSEIDKNYKNKLGEHECRAGRGPAIEIECTGARKAGVTGISKGAKLVDVPSQNKNMWKVSAFFRAKTDGNYIFHLAEHKGSKLFVNNKQVATATADGSSWVTAKALKLKKGQQIPIRAEGAQGQASQAAVGVTLPSGQTFAPIEAKGKSDPAYELCSDAACSEDVTQQVPILKASGSCDCDQTDRPKFTVSNKEQLCSPSLDIKTEAECKLAAAAFGVRFDRTLDNKNDHRYCFMQDENRVYFNKKGDSMRTNSNRNPLCKYPAGGGKENLGCQQPLTDPKAMPWCYCKTKGNPGVTNGKQAAGGTLLGRALIDATTKKSGWPVTRWCAGLCSNTAGCKAWNSVGEACDMFSTEGTVRAATGATGKAVAGLPLAWSYCLPEAAPIPKSALIEQAASRQLLSHAGVESDDDSWAESLVSGSEVPEEEVPAWIQAEPKNAKTVDCVDGTSSTSRENQLGNSRGTANPDPAIPHGINANRYIWTVPDHVQENCVLRLRYNISTGDYWDQNAHGTPMTDHKQNEKRRRTATGKSPVIQDPYVGVGDQFLSLAVNTNQYGRTFQDRSYVFAIEARPNNVPANANIYNLGMRGKRGNIVQTYPAVEYDFMPNDLCLTKGDFVHFQWAGSDYNPQRNPNDAEGAGDLTEQTRNKPSRADRTNLVDMDLIPNTPVGRENNPKDQLQTNFAPTGVGLREGEVASGNMFPAGALSLKSTVKDGVVKASWADIEAKYEGMFWTADGKVDRATIMKLALLDQKKCKSMTALQEIQNQNDRQRDPENCAKLNSVTDKNGVRTPYFDGGLVKMNKGGSWSFMSTRNNNFSNRNQVGFMCVKDGNKGKCAADGNSGCQAVWEQGLLAKFKSEDPAGKAKELLQLEDHAEDTSKPDALLAELMALPEEQRAWLLAKAQKLLN